MGNALVRGFGVGFTVLQLEYKALSLHPKLLAPGIPGEEEIVELMIQDNDYTIELARVYVAIYFPDSSNLERK